MAKILVVRFGAMGDILHAMPAVAALRQEYPGHRLAWVMEPRWIPLLNGTTLADEILPLDRRSALSVWMAWRWLRGWGADMVFDFQGLWKSAVTGAIASGTRIGFAAEHLRERGAGVFYTRTVAPREAHVARRNLELVGATRMPGVDLGPGRADGALPAEPFVLAAPFAGWRSKQWPEDRYAPLAALLWRELRVRLVLNVAPGQPVPDSEHIWRHESSLEGLLYATRRAAAVIGLDSGPLHLADLLGKRGVALFGPTDPDRNGPYRGSIVTLRAPGAATTYRRAVDIAPSMEALSLEQVFTAISKVLA